MKAEIVVYYLCCFISALLFHKIEGQYSISEFEDHFIVPHLLPSLPKEICSVVYQPGLIILTGKSYFPYQIQGVPDISWSHEEDTYYTVIVVGAFHAKPQYASTTAPELISNTTVSSQPPEYWWWPQWIKVNVYESDLTSTGYAVQPYIESARPQPNSTHDIIYAFAIYKQSEEIEFPSYAALSAPRALLREYFIPITNFENYFNKSILLAGNFFYVSPMKIVLDTSVVRRIRWKD